MDKKQFIQFCKNEFNSRGFERKGNAFYLNGQDLLCGINLQKSNHGEVYYVNYFYFIGNFENCIVYPSIYESDIQGRILVMSKNQTFQGKQFMTAQIEYEMYTEGELRSYFDKALENEILPPINHGKMFIYDNLGEKYTLTLNPEAVVKKLLT